MSFSAVLGLISGYAALRPWLNRLHGKSLWRRFGAYVLALALTSALAGTASALYGAIISVASRCISSSPTWSRSPSQHYGSCPSDCSPCR